MDMVLNIQSMLEKRFGFSRAQLAPQQVLTELGVESLCMMDFMLDLEDAFSIDLSAAVVPAPCTIAQLAALVESARTSMVFTGPRGAVSFPPGYVYFHC